MISFPSRRRVGPSFINRSRNLGRLVADRGNSNTVAVGIVLRRGGKVWSARRGVPVEAKGCSEGWVLAAAVL